MAKLISCLITSPKTTRVYEKVRSVTLPAFAGQMQILPRHAEAFVLLKEGQVVLRRPGKQGETVAIAGGACHVKGDRVVIILDNPA
jgi:F-type H+-transporting ATPase subunit epsilon